MNSCRSFFFSSVIVCSILNLFNLILDYNTTEILNQALEFRLALRAVVAAALADGYAFNRSTAGGAGFILLVGNLKLNMGGALFTAGAEVCIDAGAFIADSCP